MRIGELARRTGVPVPTIKYYTREGLLPPGERTSPNQVRYAESHVRRLKLIRAMLEVGGLSIAAAREVLAEVDSPRRTVHGMLGVAQSAVTKSAVERGTEEDWERAEHEVRELVRRHGWAAKPENPGWKALVQIVVTYRDLQRDDLLALLDTYADAAGKLAIAELGALADVPSTDGKVEGVVLGTVLGDAAMSALRRIAQEDVSGRVQKRPHSA
ncbi:MerR family transcriptional regulator [Streptomyces himalayensis]|uniref:MerR family transcriptional regulator n=1 Tax=Streptomyces himalayensis subsp. himalayensis TaxID=2756131 RepID=A0A7W0I723_9ACTN|nr:MerR family transcriptional regulator [Streptomyces himalayensis]MBA2944524.1 MerR family transcriptional regulator [Streptomyces himalayensis subsp. himalayensis]